MSKIKGKLKAWRIGRSVKHLVNELEKSEYNIDEAVEKTFGQKNYERAYNLLLKALQVNDLKVYTMAKNALDKIDPNWYNSALARSEVHEFIASLIDGCMEMQSEIVDILNRIDFKWRKSEAANYQMQHCLHMLKGYNDVNSQRAVSVLQIIDPDWKKRETARILIQQLVSDLQDSKQKFTRELAARKLGQVGEQDALTALIEALTDKDYEVRNEAVIALGKICDSQAVAGLTTALNDIEHIVGMNAALALGKIGDKKALGPLILHLGNENREFADLARSSLEKIDFDWRNTYICKGIFKELIRKEILPNIPQLDWNAHKEIRKILYNINSQWESTQLARRLQKKVKVFDDHIKNSDYRAIQQLVDELWEDESIETGIHDEPI